MGMVGGLLVNSVTGFEFDGDEKMKLQRNR